MEYEDLIVSFFEQFKTTRNTFQAKIAARKLIMKTQETPKQFALRVKNQLTQDGQMKEMKLYR